MLSTISDVKTVARKVWADAITINVGLAPTDSPSQKMYRVSAIGADDCLLGRLDAPSLNKLKALLEQRLTAESKSKVQQKVSVSSARHVLHNSR